MAKRFAIILRALFVSIILTGLLVEGGCRRNKTANSNGKNTTATQPVGPDEAKRQAESLVEQGKELYKNDQDEQAGEVFKKAIAQDPNNAEAHLRLGMSYAALGQKTEADDEYKKSIDLFRKRIQADAKDAAAYFYLGEAHTFLHQDEEAARSYRQATKLKPDDEEAFYQLGMAETRLAHYPEASAAFQKALELDPNDYRATDALENAKEGTQRIREGKKHAEEMLKKQQEANANLNANSGVKPPLRRPTPHP